MIDWLLWLALDGPLHDAAEQGDVARVRSLIAQGVAVDEEDEEGETALLEAAEEGRLEVVRLLLDQGARIDHQDHDGETALMEACQKGHYDVVELLLRRGSPVGSRDRLERSALDHCRDEGIRERLRRRGARAAAQPPQS